MLTLNVPDVSAVRLRYRVALRELLQTKLEARNILGLPVPPAERIVFFGFDQSAPERAELTGLKIHKVT